MSRLYDAKQEALTAYKHDKLSGVALFINFMGMDASDIEYELGESIEDYIYGKENDV